MDTYKESIEELISLMNDCEVLKEKRRSQKRKIAEAIIQHGIIVPHCFSHDTVYYIDGNRVIKGIAGKTIYTMLAQGVYASDIYIYDSSGHNRKTYHEEDFGEVIFFNETQAREALEKIIQSRRRKRSVRSNGRQRN